MNPSAVVRASGDRWVVFCRYPASPQPGQGSIWAVEVDARLKPKSRPVLLVDEGIDPRVVAIDDRVLVFYALLDRDQNRVINGSTMVVAEFSIDGPHWTCLSGYRLPKFPLAGQHSAEAQSNWEKNWVPFRIDDVTIGLIYAHEPWDVITLDVTPGEMPRLEDAHRSAGLVWDYGTIRGGTPPVRYDDDHLVTFFHAAQVVGSRRVYTAGAAVFLSTPPYTPRLQTAAPLLIAPYRSGAHRFGWAFAGSVVFPAGAVSVDGGYEVFCGLDDGEIGTFRIAHAELAGRLTPVPSRPSGTLYDGRTGEGVRVLPSLLFYAPDPSTAALDLPIVAFARIIAGRGRTFLDVGADTGAFALALAPLFDRVIAFEPSDRYDWLVRNRAFNDVRHLACTRVFPGDGSVPAAPALDQWEADGLVDVDLIKLDAPGQEAAILRGAVETLAASRPAILLKTADPETRARLQSDLQALDYSFELLFPRTPAWVLCRPLSDQRALDWFL